MHPSSARFLNCIRDQWLTTIGPERLTVYRRPARTNNAVESNNAALRRRLGNRNTIWNLVRILREMGSDAIIDNKTHGNGVKNIRYRPSKATKIDELDVTRAWTVREAIVFH